MASTDIVRFSVGMSWSAPLPRPDDLAAYPAEARDAIIRAFEASVELEREESERQYRLDRAESDRLDREQELESKRVEAAQGWTGILNATLLIFALVLGVMGFAGPSAAAFGALAVINVSAFLPGRLGGKPKGK